MKSQRRYEKSGALTTDELRSIVADAITALPAEDRSAVETSEVEQQGAGIGAVEIAIILTFVKPLAEKIVNKIWHSVEERVRRDPRGGSDAITRKDTDEKA